MPLLEILSESAVAFTATVFIFSLMVGSFLNVVIYRLPVMMENEWKVEAREFLELPSEAIDKFNLSTPASTCPKCGHKIRPWENIPVLSYLFLRGKCSNCKTPISVRYPIVELVTAGVSALVAWQFGWSLTSFFLIPFFWMLISLTMIDADTQYLPDIIVYPLLWIGLLANAYEVNSYWGTDLRDAVFAAMAGYLALWGFSTLFKILRNKEGMGHGDFKLFAAFGAWFGIQSLLPIILLSSVVGAVVGIIGIVAMGRDKELRIPFGPYLCGAAAIYAFYGPQLLAWWQGVLMP